MAALPLIWVAVISLVVVRRVSRAASTTLGLSPAPAAVRTGLPRLVFSKGERRFLLALRRAFASRPVRLPGYSQPRLRNHMSMPHPIAMHTPQKMG